MTENPIVDFRAPHQNTNKYRDRDDDRTYLSTNRPGLRPGQIVEVAEIEAGAVLIPHYRDGPATPFEVVEPPHERDEHSGLWIRVRDVGTDPTRPVYYRSLQDGGVIPSSIGLWNIANYFARPQEQQTE